MKTKRLSPLLALIIAFEMIVAPTAAHAQGLSALVNAFSTSAQVYSQTLAAGQPNANMSIDQSLFTEQRNPQPDEYFNPQRMAQIPGLVEYLRAKNPQNPRPLDLVTCATLRTTLHEVDFEGCSGTPSLTGVNPAQAEAAAKIYRDQYAEIAKVYNNYAADSTGPGQGFGLGCMRNAVTLLNAFFNERVSELDAMTAEINTVTSKFVEDARTDMNAIEENTAVLEGGSNEIVNNAKTRRPDLFDYSKRFDNPACKSMFPKEDYNRLGETRGLNGINRRLQDTLKAPSGPPNNYSGESYTAAHANILEDINSLATKVNDQANTQFKTFAQTNDFGRFASEAGNVPSAENIQLGAGFFSQLQTNYAKRSQKYQDEFANLRNELGQAGAGVLALTQDLDAGGFEAGITSMRNGVENSCLQRTLVSTNSVKNILSRMESNQSGDFALKQGSTIAPRVEQIFSNTTTSTERKLQLLAELEREVGNRYFLNTDNTHQYSEVIPGTTQVRKVTTRARSITPTTYLSTIVRDCQAQFMANNIGNQFSGAEAINKLRSLRSKYADMRKDLQKDMAKEVRRKLITCESSSRANNTTEGSCTSASFNTSSPRFCANGAFDCAAKMKSCNAQSEKFVSEIKADRTRRAAQYKGRVEIFRTTLNNLINAKLQKFAAQGRALNDAFSAAYTAPDGIQTQLPESQRYLESLKSATSQSPDGELLLEDPEAYAKMVKDNIARLKKSVVDQQTIVMAQNSPLKNHVETVSANVYKNVAKEAEAFVSRCNSGRAFYERAIIEAANAQKQLGEKTARLCTIYSSGSDSNPAGFCGGNLEDLMSVDPVAVTQLQTHCRRYNNNDENNNDTRSAVEACFGVNLEATSPTPLEDACKKLSNSDTTCDQTVPTTATTDATELARREQMRAEKAAACSRSERLEQTVIVAFERRNSDSENDRVDVPPRPSVCVAGNNDLTRVGENLLGAGQQQAGAAPNALGR